MYCTYVYNPAADKTQVLSDLVSLFTGETDKNNLSASCNKDETVILDTYDPAGWEIWDADAGINRVAIRAPCNGDSAQFKYVVINTDTTDALNVVVYESWNNTTHVGINGTEVWSNNTAYDINTNFMSGGSLVVSSSNRRALITSVYGNGGGATITFNGVLELDRGFSWLAVGTEFTPFGYVFGINGALGVSIPKARTVFGSTTLGSTGQFGAATPINAAALSATTSTMAKLPIRSKSAVNRTLVLPITGIASGGVSSDITFSGITASDVWYPVVTGTTDGDEITFNGKTYVVYGNYFVVPKG